MLSTGEYKTASTAQDQAIKNERLALNTLAKVGWSRPQELVKWSSWPGQSALDMARRTLERLHRQGLLKKLALPGRYNGNAYLLSEAGFLLCKSLGIKASAHGREISVGARWHEHVLSMHVLNTLKSAGYEPYFPREIAWSKIQAGDSKDRSLRQLGEFIFKNPLKLTDGAAFLRNDKGGVRCATVEIEWSQKDGKKRAIQVNSILNQVRQSDAVPILAYPWPPQIMGRLLADRKPVKPAPLQLNHETLWRAAFNRAGATDRDLKRIRFCRLHVEHNLELERIDFIDPSSVDLKVVQAGGNLQADFESASEIWQMVDAWDENEPELGASYIHFATGYKVALRQLRSHRPDWCWQAQVFSGPQRFRDSLNPGRVEEIFEELRQKPLAQNYLDSTDYLQGDFDRARSAVLRWAEQNFSRFNSWRWDMRARALELAHQEGLD